MLSLQRGSRCCIFGAGGQAKDLLGQISHEGVLDSVACLVDEFDHSGRSLFGKPVMSFESARATFPESDWLVAVGDPQARCAIAARIEEVGDRFGTFLSDAARNYSQAPIGHGSQVFSGATISTDVRIGRHVLINYGCSISHDTVVGDYATISPACAIAGRVAIGDGTFLGIGSSVTNGEHDRPLSIGNGAIVGAGACVVGSVSENAVVVGVPAKSLSPGSR